jgi:hypothetical protein
LPGLPFKDPPGSVSGIERQHRSDPAMVIQTILEQQKPEAAYFITEGGRRAGILILNMNDASELPRIAEPRALHGR